jgi:hypothetical protein
MINRFSSQKTLIKKGGNTMKLTIIGITLVLGLSAASYAATPNAQFDIYEGWNLISVPTVPVDSNPYTVFDKAPGGIDFMLSGWDPTSGGKPFEGDVDSFGGVLLGDAFWLYVDSGLGGAKISYTGLEDGVPTDGVMTDMWISLPGNSVDAYTNPDPNGDPNKNGGGWHLVGCPFNHPVCVNKKDATQNESYIGDRVLFTDGTEVKTWYDAVMAGWVDYKMSGNDPVSGGFDIQYDGGGLDTSLQPGTGYWLNTYKDNLAMIILANN